MVDKERFIIVLPTFKYIFEVFHNKSLKKEMALIPERLVGVLNEMLCVEHLAEHLSYNTQAIRFSYYY